jgi:hypothetical protein
MNTAPVIGCESTARDANCRSCATESATNLSAFSRSISLVAVNVVSAGTSARGSASLVVLASVVAGGELWAGADVIDAAEIWMGSMSVESIPGIKGDGGAKGPVIGSHEAGRRLDGVEMGEGMKGSSSEMRRFAPRDERNAVDR